MEDTNTIEEKRRKNVIDNQNFLQSLKLFNVRDDLKSTVNSVKKARKKYTRKESVEPSEVRRSSRVKTIVKPPIYNDDEGDEFILSTDDEPSDEDEEDLISAFISKTDDDWQPLPREKVRKVKKPVSDSGVKIYHPNIGLQASKVISKDRSQPSRVVKKMNVAISSSEEEEYDETIREKNVRDNRLFLEKLQIKNIRKDLVKSTRSVLPKKPPIKHEKIERVTRYSLKVQSGEIVPPLSRWKRGKNQPSEWTLLYKDNRNPYQRAFKPRKRD